jgi:hypothetical protein
MLMIARLFVFRNIGRTGPMTMPISTHWLIRQQVEQPFAADQRP